MDSIFTHSEKYDINKNRKGEEIAEVYEGIAASIENMINEMLKVFPNVKPWAYSVNVVNFDK